MLVLVCKEKTIFPNLLTRSINPHIHSNKPIIEIDLIVHLDASGSEVFFQVGALAPDDIPDLFGKYGHAKPEVTAGYAGKEGDYAIYLKTVIEKLALGCRKLYRTDKFPNSLIKFNWTKFVADRHAFGPGFGWKICNANYPSGVTTEHGIRKTIFLQIK